MMRTVLVSVGVMALASTSLTAKPGGAGPGAGPTPSAVSPAPPAPAASSAAFESQMLTFYAVEQVATALGAQVCATPSDGPLILYDQAAFASAAAYQAFVAAARILKADYMAIADNATDAIKPASEPKDATGPVRAHAFAPISPVADLTALLGTIAVSANSQTYGTVVVSDAALAIAITKGTLAKCRADRADVVYPPLFGVGGASLKAGENALGLETGELATARKEAHRKLAAGNDRTKNLATQLADVDTLYDNLFGSLAPAAGSTSPQTAGLIEGAAIASLLARPGAQVLVASVLAAGGTAQTHTSFIRKLGAGDRITHSGGIVVDYVLWGASDGKVLKADILRYRVPFTAATGNSRDAAAAAQNDPLAAN